MGFGGRRGTSSLIKKNMNQLSGSVLAGRSYVEVVKSQSPVVKDGLHKGQTDSEYSDIATLQAEAITEDLLKISGGYKLNQGVQDARRKGNVSSSAENVREGHVSPSGRQFAKEITGVQTEPIIRREDEKSAARFVGKKCLAHLKKTDVNLRNSNAAGPSTIQFTKELASMDESPCTPWAADPVSLGLPANSECSRPLSGCHVKLKTKRASISHNKKKSKPRGSSLKRS
ncbi:hypothetical protein Ancab_035043 [Ancistrocladus abbreviatus]